MKCSRFEIFSGASVVKQDIMNWSFRSFLNETEHTATIQKWLSDVMIAKKSLLNALFMAHLKKLVKYIIRHFFIHADSMKLTLMIIGRKKIYFPFHSTTQKVALKKLLACVYGQGKNVKCNFRPFLLLFTMFHFKPFLLVCSK